MADRRVYSEEFKRDALKLAEARGTIGAAARELGIDHTVLRRWKERLEANPERAFPGHGIPQDEELAKLKRENARLKEDNEILKKAVGIFTKRSR